MQVFNASEGRVSCGEKISESSFLSCRDTLSFLLYYIRQIAGHLQLLVYWFRVYGDLVLDLPIFGLGVSLRIRFAAELAPKCGEA